MYYTIEVSLRNVKKSKIVNKKSSLLRQKMLVEVFA